MIENKINLKKYVSALTVLDIIISGGRNLESAISEGAKHGATINTLFDHILNPGSESNKIKLHPYVYDTFRCFIDHKEEITIEMDEVWQPLIVTDKELLDVLFHDVFYKEEYDEDVSSWIDKDGTDNLIKPALFQVFHNIKVVRFQASDFPFSLLGFLSTIENTSIEYIFIQIPSRGDLGSVIQASPSFVVIKDEYKAKGYNIEISEYSSIHIELL